jgi:hypothetical protein
MGPLPQEHAECQSPLSGKLLETRHWIHSPRAPAWQRYPRRLGIETRLLLLPILILEAGDDSGIGEGGRVA